MPDVPLNLAEIEERIAAVRENISELVEQAAAYSGAADEELLRWSTEGNTKAFDAIVVRHGPFALRVARRLIPDRVQAQDVVQEAMLRAMLPEAGFSLIGTYLPTGVYCDKDLLVAQGWPACFAAAGVTPP